MSSRDWERIPAYCPLRYYYEHCEELCECDQPYTYAFCIKHFYRKREISGGCCEYHIPQLNRYLKYCASEDNKANAIEQARE